MVDERDTVVDLLGIAVCIEAFPEAPTSQADFSRLCALPMRMAAFAFENVFSFVRSFAL
jgi:hypothetical protein